MFENPDSELETWSVPEAVKGKTNTLMKSYDTQKKGDTIPAGTDVHLYCRKRGTAAEIQSSSHESGLNNNGKK